MLEHSTDLLTAKLNAPFLIFAKFKLLINTNFVTGPESKILFQKALSHNVKSAPVHGAFKTTDMEFSNFKQYCIMTNDRFLANKMAACESPLEISFE